jgi:uracil-DNA glycosylase
VTSLSRALSIVDPSGEAIAESETRQPYFEALWRRISADDLVPPVESVFAAFALPLPKVRAVILGQDPYPTPGRAVGRAFAVAESSKPKPPSLRNIFNEVERCYGKPPSGTTLEGWQRQGVLLLNVCLSAREGLSGSHHGLGWERFTDRCLAALDARPGPLAYLLWGRHAAERRSTLGKNGHAVFVAAHPAYAHQGFAGCGHFELVNEYLLQQGSAPIDWTA